MNVLVKIQTLVRFRQEHPKCLCVTVCSFPDNTVYIHLSFIIVIVIICDTFFKTIVREKA